MMKAEFPACPICNHHTDYGVSGPLKNQVECLKCGATWFLDKKYNWKGEYQGLLMQLMKIGQTTPSAEIVGLLHESVPLSMWKNIRKEDVIQSSPDLSEADLRKSAVFDGVSYWKGDKKILESMKGDIVVTQDDVRFVNKGGFMKGNKKLLKMISEGKLGPSSNDYKVFLQRLNNPMIRIPIDSIEVEGLKYETLVDVKQRGTTMESFIFGLGGGEKRTNYYVVQIPYKDSDGVNQIPKFFVKQKEGMELHTTIYQKALIMKKETEAEKKVEIETRRETIEKDSEAIRILKLRLAKGEITKEQYEEMKAIVEN